MTNKLYNCLACKHLTPKSYYPTKKEGFYPPLILQNLFVNEKRRVQTLQKKAYICRVRYWHVESKKASLSKFQLCNDSTALQTIPHYHCCCCPLVDHLAEVYNSHPKRFLTLHCLIHRYCKKSDQSVI